MVGVSRFVVLIGNVMQRLALLKDPECQRHVTRTRRNQIVSLLYVHVRLHVRLLFPC